MIPSLKHIRKRKIVEWALAYCAGAWLVMQLVDVLSSRWSIPLNLQRGVDVLLIVGFFLAITLAWYHGEKGRQRVSGAELLIITALLGVVGALLTLVARVPGAPTQSAAATESHYGWSSQPGIAVLPFRNLTDDPEQEYFVAGMHEALITSLSRIPGLRVISRTSVMRYADSELPIPRIAKELDVTAVIEGSVNRVDDHVRITVQLIDGQSDGHLWGDDYDRNLKDVLILMSQVAESVAERVEVSLAPQVSAQFRSVSAVNPELNELYMRGRHALASFTGDGVAQAILYFEQAIALDDSFAPAWAGLAGTHVLGAYLGYLSPKDSMADAKQTARRALRLDPELASAYTALGWVHLLEFQWDSARQSFDRALAINPNDVDALHGLGDYLTITGRSEDGLILVRKARGLDPFSPIWGHSVIAHLHMMGRFEQALAEAEDVMHLFANPSFWSMIGNAHWELGQREEACEAYQKAFRRQPQLLAALEAGLARGGPDEAMSEIARAAADAAIDSGHTRLSVALWHARAKDIRGTLNWLQKAYGAAAPDIIYVDVRPEFKFVHDEPEYRDLLETMKLGNVQAQALESRIASVRLALLPVFTIQN